MAKAQYERRIAAVDNVINLRGVGPKRANVLCLRNIRTIRDLALMLPYTYVDLRKHVRLEDLCPGMHVVVAGSLSDLRQRPMRGRGWRRMSTGWLTDDHGRRVKVVWFNLPAYAKFPAGEQVILHGRVVEDRDGGIQIVHPEVYRLTGEGPPAIRPLYRAPAEIPQRTFASLVTRALGELRNRADSVDSVPASMRSESGLRSVEEALTYLHEPPADANIEGLVSGDTWAHRTIAFDEMFAFELALCREKINLRRRAGARLNVKPGLTAEFMAGLPFRPTDSQLRAIGEIAGDLASPTQMNRMLIGDVGSGKTLVAFWSALRAVESGWQVAMMAPTELLAEQHCRTFANLCHGLGVEAALLTGKATGSDRQKILRALADGDAPIVFGTQALIQEAVRIKRLGLAIIDEQHRFGVFDRARLASLGVESNVLLMTATPIPRSLAMVLFRNLDVSVLDEMPPGRTPIITEVCLENEIGRADAVVRAELDQDHRAYYIAPLIEGEEDEPESVAAVANRLSNGPLAGFHVGVMHGRMRPADKEKVMRDFRDGNLDVLVSTTVVEVGIDVPEATAIVIVAAERYGLAQLHQLRGRVGRGPWPSRCCLVLSNGAEERASKRLEVLVRSESGADVAHADLQMRGPGDLLGARQAGALPLRFAGFIRDYDIIERAANMAQRWLERDPGLKSAESAGVRRALRRMLDFGFSLGDVG